MTEIYVHLQSMRDSANQMRQSVRTLQQSASSVRALYVTLPMDVQTKIIAEMGFVPNLDAVTWLDQLIDFSHRLDNAATEIEDATRAEEEMAKLPAIEFTGMTLGDLLPRILGTGDNTPMRPEPEVPMPEPDGYLSRFNRPVYIELVNSRDNLQGERDNLADLHILRAEKVSDLQALENRMASAGVTNIDMQPRIQTMRSEIARIDQDIRGTENNIQAIETRIAELEERLARVAPGRGANIDLIRGLENSETMDSIRQQTYGCVNHIVSKMPIPPGIPNDAYLWNENAETFAEYGITTGDVPLIGSVIVFEREHSFADDQFGHLMYVERVENGEVWITDNYNPDVPVRLSDITSEVSGENVTYLYFPWHTRVI
jgi:hypothetical protein